MTRLTSGDAPQSPREIATQKIQLRKQQENLLSDLLTVVDALDRAADHWQQAEQNQIRTRPHAMTRWQQFRQWLSAAIAPTAAHEPETLATVVISARIRRRYDSRDDADRLDPASGDPPTGARAAL